ncbi:MAG: hypothetical protein HOE34_07210 [Pelagibacterales bacterium]|jgi:hypothetical protein|nr:hypothetical protein [Pelagibacterales bacterium]
MKIKCFKINSYAIYFIILLIIFKIFPSYAESNETFNIPNDFKENALVLDYNESITGVISIKPEDSSFAEYTWLKLYKIKDKDLILSEWLYDRLHHEIHNIINVERLLRGPDSPILEARMNYSLTDTPSIDKTIKIATINPELFCDDIIEGFNKEGKYSQLYCSYPLGLFKFYLVLRLQKINNIYYYVGASALNHIRIRKILEIANTFSLN